MCLRNHSTSVVEKPKIYAQQRNISSNQLFSNFSRKRVDFTKFSTISEINECYFYRTTVWKNDKFSLTKEKFRQINSLVIYLVKPLLSRDFRQKCVRVNFRNFHSVVWRNDEFSVTKEIFRQINSLVLYLVKPLISRNFCQKYVRENSRNSHTVSKFYNFCNMCFVYSKFSVFYEWNMFK